MNTNLLKRIASSLVLMPLAIAVVYFGGIAYALVIAAIVSIALFEWLRLVAPELPKPMRGLVHTSLLAVLFVGVWHSTPYGFYALLALTVIVFLASMASQGLLTSRPTVKVSLLVAFGLPYMAGAGLAFLYLRSLPETGLALTCYLLASVWGTDIGAYAAGSTIGGPKIAPAISPNKTWAGLVGGMALAALFGYLVALAAGPVWIDFRTPLQAAGFSVLIAVVAQAGDFFKSFFKRRAGVKDSGHLIPGHGGALDRIDGLVFAAMFLAIVEFWV